MIKQKQISEYVEEIKKNIIGWRRDFHQNPEVGWTEFRTASIVANTLAELGFVVRAGSEAVNPVERMGVPEAAILVKAKERALQNGGHPYWLDKMEDGLTGVVGSCDTGRPGPSVAFRFDMDALEITEDLREAHKPASDGFRSQVDGMMHACGHDGHTAIGLGLATLISRMKDELTGRIILIFQPAEEGGRGAKAMVDAGVVDDVDFFFTGHLGMMAQQQKQVVCGVTNFFASTKIDVELEGVPAHAALAPHEGRNALLAAATIALQLQAISRHGEGESRINVGMMQAGEGRNIIASKASLKLETRGSTSEVNQFMTEEAIRIIRSVASMYGVTERIEVVGQTLTASCDAQLANIVKDAVRRMGKELDVIDTMPFYASEDATYMMRAVQERGGKATYMLFGTELKAGHHHHSFDFEENALPQAVEIFTHMLMEISKKGGEIS